MKVVIFLFAVIGFQVTFADWTPPELVHFSTEDAVNLETFEIIKNPPVPFIGSISGGFVPNSAIIVRGRTAANFQRFDINFMTSPNGIGIYSIGLHLAIYNNQIVVNSMSATTGWGNPINIYRTVQPGKDFEVYVQSFNDRYKIYVDGNFLVYFQYRMNTNDINVLFIEKDVQLYEIAIYR